MGPADATVLGRIPKPAARLIEPQECGQQVGRRNRGTDGLSPAPSSTRIAPVKSLFPWLALTVLASLSAAVADTALDASSADKFARLALAGLDREYPNKPGEVLRGPQDVLPPRTMHPAFFGCFDWHSSVHGHWMLVRLLRFASELPSPPKSARGSRRISPPRTSRRRRRISQTKENKSFERMYGWALGSAAGGELRIVE